MSDHCDPQVQKELAAFRARVLKTLPKRFAAIDEAWADLRRHPQDPGRMETLSRLAHNLAGSSGLAELQALREAARELETFLDDLVHQGRPVDPGSEGRLAELVAELRGNETTS